jgi:hypothetical protein
MWKKVGNKLIARQIEAEIFQIMGPCATDRDDTRHGLMIMMKEAQLCGATTR